ncbi:hypothetical protein RUM44_001578 [Polyplax serrata]|uniref:Uncharacterized protein n=1 Tax=Polyplax serrata TaxID=468196 RepID=A0ABR1AKH0_POLSC
MAALQTEPSRVRILCRKYPKTEPTRMTRYLVRSKPEFPSADEWARYYCTSTVTISWWPPVPPIRRLSTAWTAFLLARSPPFPKNNEASRRRRENVTQDVSNAFKRSKQEKSRLFETNFYE